MASVIRNALGIVRIEDKVVAQIACQAAMETYGVVGMAAKNKRDGLYELLHIENMMRGVQVISSEEDHVSLYISVILESEIRIAVVAENLIEKTKFYVESLTGLTVDSVNLIVQGIRV